MYKINKESFLVQREQWDACKKSEKITVQLGKFK
jgi:hypothetical protein